MHSVQYEYHLKFILIFICSSILLCFFSGVEEDRKMCSLALLNFWLLVRHTHTHTKNIIFFAINKCTSVYLLFNYKPNDVNKTSNSVIFAPSVLKLWLELGPGTRGRPKNIYLNHPKSKLLIYAYNLTFNTIQITIL